MRTIKTIKTIPILLLALLLLLSGCGQKPDKQEEGSLPPANQETAIPIETVELDGFSIDYFKFGRGEKVFIILPGLSMQSVMNSAEAVANSYERLTEDCTIYVFDQRSNLPESYPVSEMAKDTAAAFKALGLKDIYLFGASMGGMTAMEIAADEPELVKKLLLVSTCADVSGEKAKTLDEWEKLAVAKDIEGLYLSFGEALYPPETFETLKEPLLEAAKSVTDEELSRFIILLRGMQGFNATDKLGAIKCPVFAIGDKTDGIFGPDAMATIAGYFEGNAGSEFYQYDGYGHAVYDLAPDFTERLLSFLKRGEGAFSYEHDPMLRII